MKTRLKKISMTLIFILASAGVVFFFDSFKHFTSEKVTQILWIIFFGIFFAYFNNYEFEMKYRFPAKKKNLRYNTPRLSSPLPSNAC